MNDSRQTINHLLVKLFNDILDIEAAALQSDAFKELTVTEFHIIEAIADDRPKTMSETALKTGVTMGTLTTSIDKLVVKGAVKRQRDDKDRRVVLLSLTDKGLEAYHHHQVFHQEMTDSIMKELDCEDRDVLIKTLKALQHFFEEKAIQYGGKYA